MRVDVFQVGALSPPNNDNVKKKGGGEVELKGEKSLGEWNLGEVWVRLNQHRNDKSVKIISGGGLLSGRFKCEEKMGLWGVITCL